MAVLIEYHGGCAFRLIKDDFSIVIDPGIIGDSPLISSETPANAVLVSHVHDKNFGNAVDIVKKQKAMFFGNIEVIARAQLEGAPSWRLHVLENGVPYELPYFKVTSFPVRHKKTNEDVIEHSSFLIEFGELRIAHLGHGINVSPYEEKELDVLMVTINSKEALAPEDALNTLGVIKAKLLIPMDYIEKEIEYFSKNIKYFIPKVQHMVLKPGDKISIERHITGELLIE